MRPHLEYCICLWGPQYKKGLEEVHRRAMEMIRELEHLSHEERLGEKWLLGLEKTRLLADLHVAFQYMKNSYKKDKVFSPGPEVTGQGGRF